MTAGGRTRREDGETDRGGSGVGEEKSETQRVPVEDRVEPPRRRMCQHPLEPEI